ncbi:TPA: restriction endonuclease subunit S [Vibrio parahaemolyticus]|nr:restriction endonuclease subunit S [Vibrio parahaemolyticus]
MTCNWPEISLADIYDIRSGLSKPASAFGSGFPFLSFKEVFGNYFVPEELSQLVESSEKERANGSIKRGDVFLTRTSETMHELGMSSVALKDYKNATFNGFTKRLRPKEGTPHEVHPEFVGYYFRSPRFRTNMLAFSTLSTRASLNNDMITRLTLPLPPIDIQKKIAKILKCLDDKVSVNSKMNQTLEEMAQAIFKSWFVDFDPVKAKMNGQLPEGMDEATASLFPEKLVESELGLIPEGWEIHNTQDLFEVKDGTHDSPKKAEKGHYLVTSKHITKGKIDTSSAYLISDADFDKVNQRSKVDTFDILLTMIGTVGEVVVVYDNPVGFAIKNVGLFKTSQRPELVWLFYWHLQSFKMKHYLEVRMAGTTQQYLTLKTLRTIPVVLPSSELLAKFNEVMSPLMEKISDNHKQNQTLSNLRDTLLPKLLSGEIELDVEKVNAND